MRIFLTMMDMSDMNIGCPNDCCGNCLWLRFVAMLCGYVNGLYNCCQYNSCHCNNTPLIVRTQVSEVFLEERLGYHISSECLLFLCRNLRLAISRLIAIVSKLGMVAARDNEFLGVVSKI